MLVSDPPSMSSMTTQRQLSNMKVSRYSTTAGCAWGGGIKVQDQPLHLKKVQNKPPQPKKVQNKPLHPERARNEPLHPNKWVFGSELRGSCRAWRTRGTLPLQAAPVWGSAFNGERNFVELMTSDRQLKASGEGSKWRIYRPNSLSQSRTVLLCRTRDLIWREN